MEKITIGKLAQMAGVGVETVRFYQRKELLREPDAHGSIRTYNKEDAQRIIFIKKAQELVFSLSEVKELLGLNTKPRVTCGTVKKKTIDKIAEIEMKINDLKKMKTSLEKLSCACDSKKDDYQAVAVATHDKKLPIFFHQLCLSANCCKQEAKQSNHFHIHFLLLIKRMFPIQLFESFSNGFNPFYVVNFFALQLRHQDRCKKPEYKSVFCNMTHKIIA